MKNTFKKEERLCNKGSISDLFHKGSSFLVYPYRIVSLIERGESMITPQILISVPKKRIKKAVLRNKIKRKIKEAYRLQKQALLKLSEGEPLKILIAIQYVGKEDMPYSLLYEKMGVSLNKLIDEASR